MSEPETLISVECGRCGEQTDVVCLTCRDLRAALENALEGMEEMICHVPKYFCIKWKHREYIDNAKAALAARAGGEGT